MLILGLTGSVGMGKSFVARAFAREGARIFSADAAVHELLGPNGAAVEAVAALFPEALRRSGGAYFIDRRILGRRVFADERALARLEGVLHPGVRKLERRFLARAAREGARLAVLEIPLLFETGAERRCDCTALVSAPARLQRRRVLARPGMTPEKLAGMRARQMTEAKKRARADFVIPTGQGRSSSLRAVRAIVRMLEDCRGRRWPSQRLWP